MYMYEFIFINDINLNQIRIMIGMFDKSYLHLYEPYVV